MSGIITGPYFKAYFNEPDRTQLGLMVSILEIGAFITSLMAGRVGDIYGRCVFSVLSSSPTYLTSCF